MHQTEPYLESLLAALDRIPAATLDVVYQPEEAVSLEPFPGHVIHGGLGHHLRQAVCFDLDLDCRKCEARRDCLFPPMFGPGPAAVAVTGAARPYVLSFPAAVPLVLEAGAELPIRVLLLGPAAQEPRVCLSALLSLARSGIGRERVRCRVLSASVRETHLLPPAASPSGDGLRIAFPGILRARFNGKLGTGLSFADLVRLVLRRAVSILTSFSDWRPDREALRLLVQRAAEVPLLGSSLQHVPRQRLSFSTGQTADVSGVTGSMAVGAGWQPFHSLLAAAAPLGLGKSTVMGYGQFVLVPLAAGPSLGDLSQP
jgi:hypothetical protein